MLKDAGFFVTADTVGRRIFMFLRSIGSYRIIGKFFLWESYRSVQI